MKEVVLYCQKVPPEMQQLVLELCPPELELRFLFPSPGNKQGHFEEADYIVSSIYKIDKDVIDRATKVKAVFVPSIGYNHVDVDYTREKGVYVCNAPGSSAVPTAELTVALMINGPRRVCQIAPLTKKGEWHSWTWRHDSYEMMGKTIGIVGAGDVGRRVMKMLLGFDVNIIYADPVRMPAEKEAELCATYVDLDTLLRQSDIISLHCPLTEGTRGLLGAEQFKMMKKNAFIVNEARGAVIDSAALAEALKSKEVWGAAIDCWEKEPLDPNDPLLKFDTVIATAHLGGATREFSIRSFELTYENAMAVRAGQKPINICNGLE